MGSQKLSACMGNLSFTFCSSGNYLPSSLGKACTVNRRCIPWRACDEGKQNCAATWRDVVNRAPISEISVGDVTVPRHRWSVRLRQNGVYRAVEYRVTRLCIYGRDISSTRELGKEDKLEDVVASIRPVHRLLPRFERNWPVSVRVGVSVK